jgi:hypothetical protein
LEPLILQHLQNEELFKENLDLCEECLNLISNSLARRTWQKYGSALSLWQKFAKDKNVKGFPALAFLCWCRKNTTVKSATIKGYLSALRKIKFLLGFRSKKGERTIEKIILRGMENIECRNEKQPKKIIPMDLKIMSRIKNGLRKTNLRNCTKKSVWTLNVVAFWGLLRLGEVLPGKADSFDKTSVLLWKDIEFSKEKVTLHLRQPKVRTEQSKTVVLYKLSASRFCPVKQLKQLRKTQMKKGIWGKNMPVFLRSSGGSLTKTTFLKNTNCALKKEDPNAGNLQGKSFRSGIPTLLKKSEPENMEKNLKILGRWKSSAYRCYIRNLDPGNRPVFLQTAETLLTNFFAQERNPGSESM